MFEGFAAVLVALWLLGPLWWVGLIFCLVAVIFFAEQEVPGYAVILAAVLIGLFWLTGHGNFVAWAVANPWELGWKTLAYLAVGGLYAAYRFDRYGYDKSVEYKADKKQRPGNYMEVDELATEKARSVDANADRVYKEVQPPRPIVDMEDYVPLALDNKGKITNWLILWPFSGFWYVASEGIQRVVDFFIRNFGTILNKLAARHFPKAT